MTKHYARKNMLVCAKLKEALMELETLKWEKVRKVKEEKSMKALEF